MNRKNLIIIGSFLLAVVLLTGCGQQAVTQSSIPSTPATEEYSEPITEETIDDSEDHSELSSHDEPSSYRCDIPNLRGSISIPSGFYVFGEDIPYTDEMCRDIGVEPENMKKAMPLLQGQTLIVPADEPYADTSINIYLKVKDKKYEDVTLASLSYSEYRLLASAVVSSFGVKDFDTIEGNGLRFFAFSYENQGNICRYATILNGHMIYVYANTGSSPISEEQRGVLEYIALSIQHAL